SLVAQAVVPQMIDRSYGKIINISSIFGKTPIPHQFAYAASKGGVNQITKVMALEWAKLGVRVNVILANWMVFEAILIKNHNKV
ncbi:MAG: SDR family NAD(P)-dependent oxidoreductase, partial [Thermodesulfobacteriota bacterium]